MPGAAIGSLLGMAFGTTLAAGATFLGYSAGTMWILGASLGSLFDTQNIPDFSGSTPNYSFGQLQNTKSQLLPVPIVYGRCRVAGNVFMQTFETDAKQKMNMFVGISEGEVNKIVSIYADDVQLTDETGAWVADDLQECSLNVHYGTSNQTVDSRDPDGTNRYPNVAYIALTLKAQDGLSGNPTITSIVEGRRVWTPSGERFTQNPAWIVYDLLTNPRYGCGIPSTRIDLDSFEESAAYCDTLVDGEPRFTLDYIIDTQRPALDHLQAMLGCFRGYFLCRKKIELHIERPSAVYKALGPDNFVKGSFTWWQQADDDVINRVVLEWVDPNNFYERSSAPFEWQEDIARRGIVEKKFSLLGITRATQCGRMGNYLLEMSRSIVNFCSFSLGVKDSDIEAGDVISVSYPDFTGWNNKPFRVLAVQDNGDSDTVQLTCSEYVASIYDDVALDVPTPTNPETQIEREDVFSLELLDVGHVEEDGTWIPIVRAMWQNPSNYTPKAINVRWRYSEEDQWTLHLNTTRIATQTEITGLKTGETVTVWVNCVRPDTGKETEGVQQSMVVGKDVVPPDAPTGLTATGWFGSIWLNWINPTDPDLAYVEIWESFENNRNTAVKIAEVKGTSYNRYTGSFQGRWYWIRAVDLSGNISQWNAEAGTYGYSDQESHEDFVRELLGESETAEAIEDLRTGIDSLAESVISDLLASARSSMAASLAERKAQKQAELEILGVLSDFDDYVWSLASITEERNTREAEDEALAEWIREVAAIIGDPENPGAGTVYAEVREEMRARAREDEALAQNITTLSAIIGDPGNPGIGTVYAALRAEQEARAAADETLAREVTTLAAGIGDPADPESGSVYAAIAAEASARAAADSALAQQYTTVQTQVGQNLASIQQLMSSVDGITAKWAVRLDVNGRVAGLELIGTGAHASMVFLVDTFMVGRPGASGAADFPFVIGTVDGVTKVSISDAFIQDGSIKNAKIKDLTVGRIKLASGVDAGLSWGDSTYMNWDIYEYNIGTAWFTPEGGTVTVPTESRGRVLVNAFVRGLAGGQFVYGRIQRNGVTVADMGIFSNQAALIANYMDKNPGNGNTTYRVQIRCSASPGHGYLWGCGISATVFYR